MKIKLKEGLELSRIVHGHWRLAEWNLTAQQLLELVESSIALGVTTFDHADIYGDYACERLFGNAMLLNKKLRDDIQIITKCGIKIKSDKFPERIIGSYDYSYQHIVNSANQSLKNLETDYIDLLLLHRPSPFFNPEEVAKAFDQLLQSGKVRHFGVSNFSVRQQKMLNKYLDMKLVTNQVEISPYCLEHFDNGNMDYFIQENIKPMAWSPLAGGKIMKPADEKGNRVFKMLTKIAEELGVEGIDKVTYCWLLQHPANILPIVGSGQLKRIESAVDALTLQMTTEQWLRIYVAAMGNNLP